MALSVRKSGDTTPGATPSVWRPAIAVALIGAFMAILDTFIVVVAIPVIRRDLHATPEQTQWVLAGYQLTYAGLLVTGGRLGDRFGRKRMFVLGMALFTAFSIACALAPTADVLIGSRLLQGAAAAIMFPQVFSMIRVLVPDMGRAAVFGVLGAVIGGASVCGQLIGGALATANLFGQTWQTIFWVNMPIGVVAVVLSRRLIPETRAPGGRLDLPGAAILTAALFLILAPMVQYREFGWSAATFACLATGGVALGGFVVMERRIGARGGDPLLSMRLFGLRPFVIGIGLILVVYSGVTSFFMVLSLVLQDGLGLSPMAAGLAYAPDGIAFLAGSVLAGRLVPRHGARVPAVGACLLALGVVAAMIVAFGPDGSVTTSALLPALVAHGLGGGMLVTPLMNVVLARIGPGEVGMASGMLSTTQQVGAAVGVAVVGVIYFGSLNPAAGSRASSVHAFGVATVFIVAIAVAAALTLFSLHDSRGAATAPAPGAGGLPDPSVPRGGTSGAISPDVVGRADNV